MMRKTVPVIKVILNVQKLVPVGIKWKEVLTMQTSSIQSEKCEKLKMKNTPHMEGTKDNRQVNNE